MTALFAAIWFNHVSGAMRQNGVMTVDCPSRVNLGQVP
ncbi:MAG: hypothetical protein QOJ90_1852 [Actinomycetota bacterium]|jgi:hypothetical protein|nr:hypothetical protein [Actinomycetota bacterium]MDQ1642501.1 hypothetical protein [Actinomycetota bacterium]